MRFRSALSLCLGLVISIALAGCGGGSSSSGGSGGGGTPTLSSISVSPASASLAISSTQSFTATGHYSDGTTKDLTSSASWSSSDSTVATISSGGLATGVAAGTATVTATSGGKSGTATITVTAANLTSITISPATASIEAGATQQFMATGHYDDSTTKDLTGSVTWTSSDSSLASIDSAGLATGKAAGAVKITASMGSVTSNQADLTVTASAATLTSITITPNPASVTVGLTASLTATGHYSDNSTRDITTQVTWTSDATAVATVGVATGVVTGVATGSATITASSDSISATVALSVTQATPTVTWSTPAAITYGTALSATQLNATLSVAGSCVYTPAAGTILPAGSQTLSVTCTPTDTTTYATPAAKTVNLTVNKATLIVSVDDKSMAYGASVPTLTGTLTGVVSGDGITASYSTTATSSSPVGTYPITAVLNDPNSKLGNYSVTNNPGTLSVGLSIPTVTWTAPAAITYGTALSATQLNATLSVAGSCVYTPAAGTILSAGSQTLSVTCTPTDTTTYAAPSPKTVSLTVNQAALVVTPDDKTMVVGTSVPTLTGTLTGVVSGDGITASYSTTATSSSPVGTYPITAVLNDPNSKLGNYTVTNNSGSLAVTAATLLSIDVTPGNSTITNSGTQQFTATGHYNNNTTANLTSSVTWSSSNTAAANIASTGLATGAGAGSTTITAISGVVSGSTTLYVTSPGSYVQGVVGDGSGNTTESTTTTNPVVAGNLILVFAHWDSASPITTVAVSDSLTNSYTPIFANPVNTNTTHYFQAWYAKNIKGGAQLQVTINFSSSTTSISTLDVMEYSGIDTVTPIDGTSSATGTGIVENSGNITVPNPNSELVVGMFGFPSSGANPYSAGSGFTGRPLNTSGTVFVEDEAATTAGTYAATANSSNSSTWAALAVGLRYAGAAGSATLQSIAVTPATATIASGSTQQYTATGTYSDNSTQDLTSSATWVSSDTSKATISSAGLATGVAAGAVTIQATYGSISGTASLTVQAPTLQSVTVSPSSSQLSTNATLQLTATAHYSDNTTQDVTSTATWSTVSSAVATVDTAGLVTGVGAGTTNIQALYNTKSGASAITVTPPGLVAWWRFNEASGSQAADSTGNGYNSTFNHGITWTSGQTGGGVSADGTIQYMSSASIDLSSTSALTLAGWVAHVWTGTTRTVLAELGTDYSTATDGFVVYMDDTTDCSAAGSIFVAVRGDTGTSSRCYGPPSTNGWHHLAVVLDKSLSGSSEVSLYIDGLLQSSTSSPGGSDNNNAFGAESLYMFSQGGTTLYGKAMVSDLRLYNRALNSTEVNQLFTLGQTVGTLQSIALSPQNSNVKVGNTVQFDALGTYSDASVRDVSTEATWASSSTGAATIDDTGLATGVAPGSTTITATDGSVNQSTGLTIKAASGTGGYAVQDTKGDSGSSLSESTGFNTSVTAGDTFVVFSHWGDQTVTVTSLTDTLGNTFTPIAGPINYGANQRAQMWYAKITNGGSEDHFTITYSAKTTDFSLLDVVEYAGLDATTPFSGVYSTATGTGTALDSGAVSVATANTQTLIGVFGADANGGYPFTVASGFAEDLPNEVTSQYESLPIAAAGNVNATATASNSVNWVAFGLLFNNN